MKEVCIKKFKDSNEQLLNNLNKVTEYRDKYFTESEKLQANIKCKDQELNKIIKEKDLKIFGLKSKITELSFDLENLNIYIKEIKNDPHSQK